MKIARCTATGLITAAPAVQNRASSEAVVHEDEFQVEGLDVEEEEATAGESKSSSSRKNSKEEQEGFTTTVCVNFSADDLRLATIPGQEEDFDPATRFVLLIFLKFFDF